MKFINRIISVLGIAAIAVSCAKIHHHEGEGVLVLDYRCADNTKAAMSQSELESTSIVNIYKGDFSGLVRTFLYGDTPKTIYLPADDYRVDIIAGEASKETPAVANWEQKSYMGSADFTIAPASNVVVRVVAKVSNVVTKVEFDPSMNEVFREGYTFTIGLDPEVASKNLVYNAQNTGSEGYFIAGKQETSLYWSFSGIVDKYGTEINKSGVIEDVEGGFIYKLSPKFTVNNADLQLDLMRDIYTNQINDLIIFEPVNTGISSTPGYEIWATKTVFHADVDEDEYENLENLVFEYIPDSDLEEGPLSKADTPQWKSVPAQRVDEGEFFANVAELLPGTKYAYRLMLDGEMLGSMAYITTAEATQLPNFDFETVSNAESNNFVSFYNPSSEDPRLQTKFWDSGSAASSMLGSGYAICYSDTDVPEGIGSTRCARLQSKYVVIKFAAGNLFVGNYVETNLLTQVGTVDFGRYWSSRPTKIRLWYKYNGGMVDYPGVKFNTGDPDIFSIQVAIGTWSNKTYKGGKAESPMRVKTDDESTFWDYETLDETVAYIKFEENALDDNKEWKQVTIPFTYKTETVIPTHIVINCAASKYGDYFAGSSTSALYIDNFELLYD